MDRADLITTAFQNRHTLSNESLHSELRDAIDSVIEELDQGTLRVAEKVDGHWQVNAWVKMAVLLYFKTHDTRLIDGNFTYYYDKVPLKFTGDDTAQYAKQGVRIVPPACARRGAFIGRDTVLMPSYVNIGAYIGEGSMVDTWATVGSCAQIGKHVHLSGGVGIGGVLEPVQAAPVIIEDHCFIGARSEVVEGVIIEEGSVISMGVYLGQSTRIYDRATGTVSYGRIPAGSVVVPGALPAADNSHSLYCAVIVKQVDQRTREKVGLNALLREAMEGSA